jgi:hypothetical protein
MLARKKKRAALRVFQHWQKEKDFLQTGVEPVTLG